MDCLSPQTNYSASAKGAIQCTMFLYIESIFIILHICYNCLVYISKHIDFGGLKVKFWYRDPDPAY